MIKKLIAFALLVAAGLGVMHFVVGWENFATSGSGDGDSGSPIRGRDTGDKGIVVGNLGREREDAITVVASGRMTIPNERLWPLPDGSFRPLTKYLLNAEDSRPVTGSDDRIELLGVLVQFFDVDDRDPENPQRVEAAVLEADSAVIQLGKDEAGRASVREDRDMDLSGVVLQTIGSSKLQPVEMRVARLLVRHAGEAGIALRTPDDSVPFEVLLGGEDPMTLEGIGLRASMPSDDVPDGADRRLELHVASRPVLVRGMSTLSAAGPLDYVEDMRTGVGRVTLRDRVRAEGVLRVDGDAEDARGDDPLVATGDAILGTLARRESKRGGDEDAAAWTSFRLLGSPAKLEGDGVELRCERIDAFPSIDGEPHVFTASGTPRLAQAREGVTFEAERIHLVQLAGWLTALHRPYGFGADAFGPGLAQLFVFEGASSVDDRKSETLVQAAEGIRVLRTEDRDGPALSLGYGAVRVTRADLVATGSDGFRIVRSGPDSQVLRLGPEVLDATHDFTIQREGEQRVEVDGHGRCVVSQFDDGGSHIELESPTADLTAKLDEGTLEGVQHLDLRTDPEGRLSSLEATGEACRFDKEIGKGEERSLVRGTAARIRAFGERRIRLEGSPATVERSVDGSVVRGGEIELFDLGGGEQIAVVTQADWTERAYARVEADGERLKAPIDLSAERILTLPRLLPESVLSFHTGGIRHPGFDLGFGAWFRTPIILASGDLSIEQGGAQAFSAIGTDLAMRLDGSAGLLTGLPAVLTQTGVEDGRTTTARSERLRVGRSASERSETVTLLPTTGFTPILELRGASGAAERGIRNARVLASGRVHATRERIDFEGPVEVFELDPNGDALPDGIHLSAADMIAHATEAGAIRELIADGDATMWVRGGVIRGDRITVDVSRTRATVLRDRGYAEFRQPSGKLVRGRRIEVDYETMGFVGWDLRLGTP